jgi:GNAT superfamily N-acetyltransferase
LSNSGANPSKQVPSVVEIVRSLTTDDIRPFRSLLEIVAPGRKTFPPGFFNLVTVTPRTAIGNTYSLIWSARNGSPKALLSVSMINKPVQGLAEGDISLTVHPEYRRRGLASRMLDRLIAESSGGYNATQVLRSQLCMKDGGDFLVAYLAKRGVPYRERFQTPEEFVDRCVGAMARHLGPEVDIMRPLMLDWIRTTSQPHSCAQLGVFMAELRQKLTVIVTPKLAEGRARLRPIRA